MLNQLRPHVRTTGLKAIGPLLITTLVLVAIGCSSGQTSSTPVATATAAPNPQSTAVPDAGQLGNTNSAETPQPAAKAAPDAGSYPEETSSSPVVLPEELFLEILVPAEESVVSEVPLLVLGRTTPDAIVSVDGQVVDVDSQGDIAALVFLEPGPNLIEVVASDLSGQQRKAMLAVIYLP